ncbi:MULTISPECIES: putative RiPP precursor [unclassified Mesorhizobium]|nr:MULTISPECIES: putative RiPP precursor [unclassified Mesorhizobium]TPN46987.1 putative RiPP precursor [Mesorhizobium sp. B1-1-9]TPN52264.1 putative RiPP precursor [Mesorhizobium sp. B1-1-7]
MKKIYEKPSLNKREKLSAVTAITCAISQPCGK